MYENNILTAFYNFRFFWSIYFDTGFEVEISIIYKHFSPLELQKNKQF